MNSIFNRTNPAIEKIFREAGSPKKVMCVPIDYAKRQHTALVCNGEGRQLKGVFNIHNTPAGVDFVEGIIQGLCKKHSIKKESVFFGGEDCSAIAFNFIHAMLQEGYVGIGLNARDAAKERENFVASTDKLDLLGIAACLINKKWGRTLTVEYSDARVLRELTHHRRALVKAHTQEERTDGPWVEDGQADHLCAADSAEHGVLLDYVHVGVASSGDHRP